MKELEKPIVKEEAKKENKKKDDKAKTAETEKKSDVAAVLIDFEEMESRLELLPIPSGNLNSLNAIKGKLIYMRYPNTCLLYTSPSPRD